MSDKFPVRYNSINRSYLRNYLFIGRNIRKNFHSEDETTLKNTLKLPTKCINKVTNQIMKRNTKKFFTLLNPQIEPISISSNFSNQSPKFTSKGLISLKSNSEMRSKAITKAKGKAFPNVNISNSKKELTHYINQIRFLKIKIKDLELEISNLKTENQNLVDFIKNCSMNKNSFNLFQTKDEPFLSSIQRNFESSTYMDNKLALNFPEIDKTNSSFISKDLLTASNQAQLSRYMKFDYKKNQEEILLKLENEQHRSSKLESVIKRYRNMIRDQKKASRSSTPTHEDIDIEKEFLNNSLRSKSQIAKMSPFKSITTFVEYTKFLKSLPLLKIEDSFLLILNNLRQILNHTKISILLFQDFDTEMIPVRSMYLRIGKKTVQVLYPLDIKYSDFNYLSEDHAAKFHRR